MEDTHQLEPFVFNPFYPEYYFFNAGKVSKEDFESFAHALSSNTTLNTINFTREFSRSEVEWLVQSLAINSSLTKLDFSYCTFPQNHFEQLENLFMNDNITYLNLNWCQLKLSGATLAECIKSNSSLISLSFDGNKIEQEDYQLILDALKQNSTLTDLFLPNTITGKMTKREMETLCEVVRTNPLWKLGCPKINDDVDSEFEIKFMQALKYNQSLEWVYFPSSMKSVSDNVVDSVFETNTTLMQVMNCENSKMKWYCELNTAFNELKPARNLRDSVPHTIDEYDIKDFLKDLIKSSEEWRALKLVVLGNGRIGKTTLIRAIKQQLNQTSCSQGPIESTIGIDLDTISLAGGEVTVYDFAGQLEYTATHQFFVSSEMVIYLLCFNLENDDSSQQILFWLQFLNSAIPQSNQFQSSHSLSKWQVMLVGLRADAKHPSSRITKKHMGTWQQAFNRLPIFKKEIFEVSSMKSEPSVRNLLEQLEGECKRIFNTHSIQIPTSYKDLLKWIEGTNKSTLVGTNQQNQDLEEDQDCEEDHQQYFAFIDELYSQYSANLLTLQGKGTSHESNTNKLGESGESEASDFSEENEQRNNESDGSKASDGDNESEGSNKEFSLEQMKRILRYLHAIGRVVMVDENTVCTDPTIIPKIVANFICPDEVRARLFKKRNIEILDEDNVKCLLRIGDSDDIRIEKEIALMLAMQTCYKLREENSNKIFFLFPSLAQPSNDICFVHSNVEGVQTAGLKYAAPRGLVFVAGFFGQLVVNFMQSLNLFRENIVRFHSNGVVLQCPGLFCGELIIAMENDSESVVIAIQATNPDLKLSSKIFDDVVHSRFVQYTGIVPEDLCPICIQLCFCSGNKRAGYITMDKLGTYVPKSQDTQIKTCAPYGHTFSVIHTAKPKGQSCWTHKQHQHHFFLSYRVAHEGKKADHIEPNSGMVQMLYDKLAVVRGKNSKSLFVFWDKQCLNYGQDWEQGFLNGLLNSQVIVLLLSTKSLELIKQNSSSKQDNVLIEIECALLKNRIDDTPVIPVFVAEKEVKEGTSTAAVIGPDQGKDKEDVYKPVSRATTAYPTTSHARSENGLAMVTLLRNQLPETNTHFMSNIKSTMEALQGFSLPKRGNSADIDFLVSEILLKALSKDTETRIQENRLLLPPVEFEDSALIIPVTPVTSVIPFTPVTPVAPITLIAPVAPVVPGVPVTSFAPGSISTPVTTPVAITVASPVTPPVTPLVTDPITPVVTSVINPVTPVLIAPVSAVSISTFVDVEHILQPVLHTSIAIDNSSAFQHSSSIPSDQTSTIKHNNNNNGNKNTKWSMVAHYPILIWKATSAIFLQFFQGVSFYFRKLYRK